MDAIIESIGPGAEISSSIIDYIWKQAQQSAFQQSLWMTPEGLDALPTINDLFFTRFTQKKNFDNQSVASIEWLLSLAIDIDSHMFLLSKSTCPIRLYRSICADVSIVLINVLRSCRSRSGLVGSKSFDYSSFPQEVVLRIDRFVALCGHLAAPANRETARLLIDGLLDFGMHAIDGCEPSGELTYPEIYMAFCEFATAQADLRDS